jgi:hypothetical protein
MRELHALGGLVALIFVGSLFPFFRFFFRARRLRRLRSSRNPENFMTKGGTDEN